MRPNIVDGLIARIWPFRCVFCGMPAECRDLCGPCQADLPWLDRGCRFCDMPLPAGGMAQLCGACLARRPPFDACVAALRYEYPVDRLIIALKYRERLDYARVLAELLAAAVQPRLQGGAMPTPECIVPVPLHIERTISRGFNQADEIGRIVADTLDVPYRSDLCRRTRDTPGQAGLSATRRRRNLRGAFDARGSVANRRLAIVDDVITTGTTVRELSAALRRAGAAGIQVWAVSRALP